MKSESAIFDAVANIYAEQGVDVEAALQWLADQEFALHAWQGDDVVGFENINSALTGGCQVTGNYPGRARTPEELRSDLDRAFALIPGRRRLCLQGHQVDRMFPGVDRDAFTRDNFAGWLDWAKANSAALDIAPAYYSHPKLDNGMSLSHPDPAIRRFWIDHGRAIRKISAEFGRELNRASVCNIWVPDGFKDTPADRFAPRRRLLEALDATLEEKFPAEYLLDAVESKLFGIGVESCTIGSHDFYLSYAARRGTLICLDSGHFHPTESIADKISSITVCGGRILLHVSRGVRWDSDHVTTLNDELLAIARETAQAPAGSVFVTLDYFDASINRLAAWVIGARNWLKALLIARLEPPTARRCEESFDFTGRLAAQEATKALPWGVVWNEYCRRADVPADSAVMNDIRAYEKAVLSRR